jgi:putative transcriptional regulator
MIYCRLRVLIMNDKEKFQSAFGAHLRQLREAKGISLREMELEGELDRHILSKIENGKNNPTLYSLKKISDTLNISLEELFKNFTP